MVRLQTNPAIVAFPPVPADIAAIATDVERLSADTLVPTARFLLGLVDSRRDEPMHATTNLHAVFGAMLALCRVLDAAAYPWDAAARGRRA